MKKRNFLKMIAIGPIAASVPVEKSRAQIVDYPNFQTILVSVRDFGAVGDGIHDDSDAIQKALNNTGNVFFPDGVYRVTKKIFVSSNTMIFGNGRGNTIIVLDNINSILFDIGSSDSIEISDLTLLSKNMRHSEHDEIAIKHGVDGSARNIKYSNLKIDGFGKSGILITKGWNVIVENCLFKNCGNLSLFDKKTGCIIFDSTFSGYRNWSGSGFSIRDCHFTNSNVGVFNDSAWNVLVENCVFEYLYIPFYKSTSGNLMVLNQCWFEKNQISSRIKGPVKIIGGRQSKNSGTKEHAFAGIMSKGRVMFFDSDRIEEYIDNSGKPNTVVDLENATISTDKIVCNRIQTEGKSGYSGSFNTMDNRKITITNGIITNVS